MTDPSLTSLPALDLLGMLYSAQANYAKSDREREIVQKQKDEILLYTIHVGQYGLLCLFGVSNGVQAR